MIKAAIRVKGIFTALAISACALIGTMGAFAETVVLLPRNAIWSYQDSGRDLGTAWRAADLPDGSWKTGKAPLGFGDDVSETDPTLPVGTVVGFGPNAEDKPMTTYFRTEVEVGNLVGYEALSVYIHVDDGAVVYINGTEAFRRGIKTEGPVAYSSSAGFKPKEETLTLPVSILRQGRNTIAAEVHQDNGQSSDLWFELGIVAIRSTKTATAAPAVLVPDPSAPLGDPTKVVLTVYGDTRNEMGFTWYTTTASDGNDVQVVTDTGTPPDFSKARSFTGTWSLAANSPKEVLHKAAASGLSAGNAYWYRVGDAPRKLWSEPGRFTTSPESGDFSFINFTDTQAKNEEEAILSAKTISAATATFKDASFIISNGDLVDVGMMEQQWDWLLGHSSSSFRNLPHAPAAGNHEEDKNSFIDHFNLKTPAGAPTAAGAYYSFNWSNAHFIVLNTNEDSPEWANLSPAQVEWFKTDAASAKRAGAEWIIVSIHKGPYTTSSHASDDDIMGANGIRTKFAPLMDDYEVDLVLQGHDHIYARSRPIQDGAAMTTKTTSEMLNGKKIEILDNPEGLIYVIPATAGPKTYYRNKRIDPSFFKLFTVADEHHAAKYGPDKADPSRLLRGTVQNFMGVKIEGKKLTATVYEMDAIAGGGTPFIIDQFGITKK